MQQASDQFDTSLNKAALDFVTYSFLGYGGGLLASIFFRRSRFIRSLGGGIGGGYALSDNNRHLQQVLSLEQQKEL